MNKTGYFFVPNGVCDLQSPPEALRPPKTPEAPLLPTVGSAMHLVLNTPLPPAMSSAIADPHAFRRERHALNARLTPCTPG
jgi:hypothetical protein